MPLYRVTVLYEAVAREQVERVVQEIERAVCPFPGHEQHRCPNRWMIMTAELDEDEAEELDDLLND